LRASDTFRHRSTALADDRDAIAGFINNEKRGSEVRPASR
jgi:hypothetical protein